MPNDYEIDSTAKDAGASLAVSATVSMALKRLKMAKEFYDGQRKREKSALEFQIPELQWDQDMRTSRQKATIDGVDIPARPMLSIPKLNQPIQLVLNQERSAHLGVKVSALTEDASDDTAEVIRDLYRREEQRSRAGLARSWAFGRAVMAGTGAYRIDTEYDEESSNPFDQRIVWKRLLYQDSVYFDPTAQEPDWSDGEWALELYWVPISRVRRDFPEANISTLNAEGLGEMADDEPEWVSLSDEAGEPSICLAVYWRKEYKKRAWVVLDDGSFSYEDEIPQGRQRHPDPKVSKRREVQCPTVYRSIITSNEELNEPEEWNGKYIPLIPVIGVEIQPFDKERRWMGIIEPSMDAQRMFNYAASSAVELAATETKAPYIMYGGQNEGYEDMWRLSAVRNFPALFVNPDAKGPMGELLPHPTRTQVDVGRLGPSMMLLEKADQFIQASTTTLDQTRIEQMGKRRVAHQTIQSLQEQSDLGNSHHLHNLATISMPYEAKVVIDLMAKIYDRPGRVARLLNGEDDERTVLLNQPFTSDEKGRPVPVPHGQEHPGAKHYDLTKGRYGVAVSIGKSWQSRLQQGADEIGDILQSHPDLVPLIGPTYFKFRDFPGSKEIGELLKKVRAKQFPGIDDDPNDPNQAAQKAEEMQQQMQMMGQQLQDAQKYIETEQAKHGATIEIEKVKAALAKDLAYIKNAGTIAVAKIQGEIKGVQLAQEAEDEAQALGHQLAHDAGIAAADAKHEERMADRQHQQALEQGLQAAAHGVASAEQGQAHALEQGEQGQANALEQGEQSHKAALAQQKAKPQPKAGKK